MISLFWIKTNLFVQSWTCLWHAYIKKSKGLIRFFPGDYNLNINWIQCWNITLLALINLFFKGGPFVIMTSWAMRTRGPTIYPPPPQKKNPTYSLIPYHWKWWCRCGKKPTYSLISVVVQRFYWLFKIFILCERKLFSNRDNCDCTHNMPPLAS